MRNATTMRTPIHSLVQKEKIAEPETTPSARVLAAIHEHGDSFETLRAASKQAACRANSGSRPPSAEEMAYFTELAKNSLGEQAEMEREQAGDFDQFITDYRSRTPKQLCD